MSEVTEKELFETLPVHKAVAALAIPAIISQIVSIIYNLADTFFIGQLGNPYMVEAVTLVYPWFTLLTALGNLFGIGGSSLWIENHPIRGCIGCFQCTEKKECVFKDKVNEFTNLAQEYGGFIFGAPVYYSGMNGGLMSFMDRIFFSASKKRTASVFA